MAKGKGKGDGWVVFCEDIIEEIGWGHVWEEQGEGVGCSLVV